ncbi:MAG TPA: peptide ABC transporter substrate-binding protein [Chloroflexota bacterium]|nr:peptide ABC transporter substrate-binding protein [Chloroflexota bacterium]
MKLRSRSLAVLLAAAIILPAGGVGGMGRGAAHGDQCCGLPSNIRTGNDGLPPDAAPLSQQTLTIPETETPYMDWEQTAYNVNAPAANMLQESLTRPDNNFNPLPAAATAWSVDKSGLIWTIALRKGMVWSDGTPITSADWVFSFQRIARADYDFEWFYSIIKNMDAIAGGKAPMSSLGVAADGPYTLKITTGSPAPFMPKLLGNVTLVPKKMFDKYGTKWSTRPDWMLFSGPYILQSWQHGVQFVMVPNPHYIGPYKPFLQKITVKLVKNNDVIFPMYRNGEVDAIPESYESVRSAGDDALIEHDPALQKQFHKFLDFMTYYLFFDMQSKPFNNLKVRQAFSHVIDRDGLLNSVLKGQGAPAYAMLPPGFPGWNEQALKGIQAFNPKLGAQLLAQAGYPNGKGFPQLNFVIRQPTPEIVGAAGAMKAMLKQYLNINVNVQQLDYGTFSNELNKNQIKLGLIPYEYDYVDPYDLLDLFMSEPMGRHNWDNTTFDGLINKANTLVSDPSARLAVIKQAEQLLVQDVAGVFIWHPYITQLWKPYFNGYALQKRPIGIDWTDDRLGLAYYTIYRTKNPVTYQQ